MNLATSVGVLFPSLTLHCFMPMILKTFYIYKRRTHYLKRVHIRSCTDPYFPAFALNMEIYKVKIRIQSEFGKIRARKTPNKDALHAVTSNVTFF